MAATREDVNRWIKYAKENKHKFIISVCDTFDYEDYPVYCNSVQEVREALPHYTFLNMQKVNEIIKIDGKKVIENLKAHEL